MISVALVCTSSAAAQAGNTAPAPAVKAESEGARSPAELRRQKVLEDADRLVQLAQELKISVDKTNKDVLSIPVVRDAERLERLAHQMRESSR